MNMWDLIMKPLHMSPLFLYTDTMGVYSSQVIGKIQVVCDISKCP